MVFDRRLVTTDYATDREPGALVDDRMTTRGVTLRVVERASGANAAPKY
jgi:hypothetical protein